MRRLLAGLFAFVLLTACGEGIAQGPAAPNQRQQTATALAIRALTPTPTRMPTITPSPFVSPTPAPTLALAPITVTPLPSQLPPIAEPTATPTPDAEPTATPEPTAEPLAAGAGTVFFIRNGDVHAYDLAAGSATRITAGESVRAAPNGRTIAVLEDGELKLVDLSDGATRTIAENVVEEPVWSPDGRQIAFVSGTQPAVYPLASCPVDAQLSAYTLAAQQARRLVTGCQPAWSPNSRRIAYVTPQIGNASEGFNTLGVVDATGENGRTLVNAPIQSPFFPDARRILYAPFWSEDGAALYAFGFVGYRALTDISTLERIDPQTGNARPLTFMADVQPSSVRARDDGTWAAYVQASAKGTLAVGAVTTREEAQIASYITGSLEVLTLPAQSLEFASAAAWAPDRSILAVVYCESPSFICGPDDRAEVRLFDPRTGETTPLFGDVDAASTLDWVR